VKTILCFGDSNTWGCAFVDAGAHVRSSDTDGIHLDAPAHQRLGAVLARQVRELLA
jgi:lysophospholipase L1-like esterase